MLDLKILGLLREIKTGREPVPGVAIVLLFQEFLGCPEVKQRFAPVWARLKKASDQLADCESDVQLTAEESRLIGQLFLMIGNNLTTPEASALVSMGKRLRCRRKNHRLSAAENRFFIGMTLEMLFSLFPESSDQAVGL